MKLENISKYFTTNVLNEVIQKCGGTHLTNWSFGAGFKKGDSYLSEVYRLKVIGKKGNGESIEINTIVKSIPKVLGRRRLFRSADFFRNEINFYTKIIPLFEKFQNEKKISNAFIEYPKCYASYCDGENDFIALEDVSKLNYETSARQDGLTLDHCLLIMRTLGRFHAVSLALKDQKPKEFKEISEHIEETYYAEKFRSWYNSFLKIAIEVSIDAVSKEYPNTIYEKKTKEFLNNNLYDVIINIVSTRNEYSVLGHGDCWIPNFLSRYECGLPKSIKIIDFQLSRYASPAVDISFFMYSCISGKMLEESFEELLMSYHDAASELIKSLGSNPEKIYPFDALKTELKENAKFGLGMGIESLPLSIMEDDDTADLDGISDNASLTDVWKLKPLPTKEKRLRLANIFKHAIDNCYI